MKYENKLKKAGVSLEESQEAEDANNAFKEEKDAMKDVKKKTRAQMGSS